MQNAENTKLARICREQARLTGSPDVRAALLELATRYERGGGGANVELAEAEEAEAKQVP